jgi:DNA-binding MarR family transcriptional regulator
MANISVSFAKLSKYNFDYISFEEVVVLELLIAHYQKKNLNNLIVSRMCDESGMKKSRVLYSLEELEKKGFVTKEEKEFKTIYILNFDKVVDALPRIYKKEYRAIFRMYYKIQNPDAFKKTAEKARKLTNEKLAVTVDKTKKSKKEDQGPTQFSLFD